LVPNLFRSVTGPVFQNPNYKMFMYMLYTSGLYQILSSQDIEFTLLIPSDEVLLNTLYGDSYFFWTEGNPLVFGDEAVQVQNAEGLLVPLSASAQERLDRKSTRLNSSHVKSSYAVFCLKKKT